ncbi:MAG: hypothetical protein AAF657_35675 [Acidobacteriota bacterium]
MQLDRTNSGRSHLVWGALFCFMAACSQPLISSPVDPDEATASAQSSKTLPAGPAEDRESASAEKASAAEVAKPCEGGLAKDDGTVETGYGYVPSAKMGRYVQELDAGDLPSRKLQEVCVCWLRSREDSDIEFEVEFYKDQNGVPAATPYAKVSGTATEVPNGVAEAGRFYSVDASSVTVPEGKSYVGVHWDPSESTFFFVCSDQSPESPRTKVFSQEDRAPRWADIGTSRDPIFKPHRSMLVRVKAAPEATEP